MRRPLAHRGNLIPLCLAALAIAVSGCGGNNADDIARGIEGALRSKPGPRAEEIRAAAREATCNALNAYSSQPATSLTKELQQMAERQKLAQATGIDLTAADPELPQRLIDAADEIDTTQKASDVAARLGC